MRKGIHPEQILEFARPRCAQFGIVPEYSFIFGDPRNAEQRDCARPSRFIRRVKKINPAVEIIVQTYVPTPQRDGMYGGVESQVQFPTTPEEWATDKWYRFTTRTDPALPWLPEQVKRRIEGFETVVTSRWPTMQDTRLPGWGRLLLKSLSSWRYASGVYNNPVELRWVQEMLRLRTRATRACERASDVASRDGYRLWAETWDATPSPIVAVEIARYCLGSTDCRPPRAGCGLRHGAVDCSGFGAIGLDASEEMLARAAEKARACAGGWRWPTPGTSGGELRRGSGALRVDAGTFGGPDAGAREFARVLAAGGTLLLSTFIPPLRRAAGADIPARGAGVRVGESCVHTRTSRCCGWHWNWGGRGSVDRRGRSGHFSTRQGGPNSSRRRARFPPCWQRVERR